MSLHFGRSPCEGITMTSSEDTDQYEGWSGWENGTWGDFQEPGSSSGTIFQIVAYSIILLTGIPGNILVLTLFGRRQVDTPFNVSNYLIMSLAASDLAVLVLYVPFYIVYENMDLVWPFGLAMCKIVFSGTHLCVYASLGTMVGIAVERYRVAFHLHVNKPLVVTGILGIWVSSFLLSIPQMMYFQLIELEPLEDETDATASPEYACELVWPDPAYEKILQPIDFVLFYLLPLGLIGVLYTKIVCILRRAIKRNVPNRRLAEQSQKIIRILILVGSVFAVCVFPVHFLQLSRVFYPQFWLDLVDERPWLFSVFAGLYLVTHVINPFIYALLHRKFRRNTVLMLKSSTQWCSHAVTWRCSSTRPLRRRQKPEEMESVVDQSVNILLKCIGKPRRKSELRVEDEPPRTGTTRTSTRNKKTNLPQ